MQYFCKNRERRLKVAASTTVNGIDYLEVSETDPQQLHLHFLHSLSDPLPLNEQNIQIEGGVRIKDIQVSDLSGTGHSLQITVERSGDFSYYTLRLVNSAVDPEPPPGFDPQLSAIDFSFKANCPSGFDCEEDDTRRDEAVSVPQIDYLAKDYASFRRLLLDRMSLLMPHWQERHAADLQVALLELLAYTGDQLSYFQDAAATEAYLGTARKRTSIRRHARLLDYHMHQGCNARVWVALEAERDSQADGALLERSTPLLSGGQGVMVAPGKMAAARQNQDVRVFETKEDLRLREVHNEINFYTWDDQACCLPRGATAATLYRPDQRDFQLEAGKVLLFEEIASPTSGRPADLDPAHRQAVRLSRVVEKEDIVNGLKVVEISWQEADALRFPLCISARIQGVLHDRLSVVRANVVLADHGRSVTADKLTPDTAPAQGPYRPTLPDREVTVAVPYDPGIMQERSAVATLRQDPHRAVPEIELVDGPDLWQPRRDLLASDRFQREFVVETQTDGTARLRFGDDILGKKPGAGFQPRARYRIGSGSAGNVGAEAIRRIQWERGGIRRVRNPLPARGGRDPESIESVRQFAPQAFRRQERAVTEADYAAMTERHPQVQRAWAQFRWTGSWHTVFLYIDRRHGLPVDRVFQQAITDHLERYRMAGYDLEIRDPVYVPLEIELTVCVKPGYFRADLKEKLFDTFSRFTQADGSRGFFHPDAFTFGQAVYVSHIYQRAMAVEGVDSIALNTFKRWGRPADGELLAGRLQPAAGEIIRLDNDPNFPENGKITFTMNGGL